MSDGFYQHMAVDTDDLVPYALNARTHDAKQVAQLAASIRRFGFTNPVLIDEDRNLIAGHGRVMAAKEINMAVIPAIVVTGLTPDEQAALVLADNKIALNAGWDKDLLRTALGNLGVDEQALTGFTPKEILTLMAEGPDAPQPGEDDLPPPGPNKTVPGDVWILGNHRVACGDSTNPDAYARLLGGEAFEDDTTLIDCIWTDPPYNVNYLDGAIANDSMADDDFQQFLRRAFGHLYAYANDGAAIYVAHADTEGLNFRKAFRAAGFKLSGCLVWVKNALVLGRSDYQWRHEPILYGWKDTAPHTWYGGRAQTTVGEAEAAGYSRPDPGTIEVESVHGDLIRIQGADLQVEVNGTSIDRVDKPSRNAEHPTMKPVALIRRHLRNSAWPGALVFDPFGGSGSTLIAAEQLGMRACLIEYEPKFVDVIVRRWEMLTGKAAYNAETGEAFADREESEAA